MNLLTEVLAQPTVIRDWQARQWNTLMPLARRASWSGVAGRCSSSRCRVDVPERLRDRCRGRWRRFLHPGQAAAVAPGGRVLAREASR